MAAANKIMTMKKLLTLATAAAMVHIVLTWVRAIQRGKQARQAAQHPAMPPMQLEQHPAVSILVPAWCEQGTIERCVFALQAIDYPVWEALILAGGPDGTLEAAAQATSGDERFRVIERGPEPKNVALNRGFGSARYDILVLLDADSIVDPNWLRALVKPLVSGAAASFGMHYPSVETWISMAEYMDVLQAYHIAGTKLAQGCSSFAIWREKLDRIGPLPANAFSWEDWDIAVKLIDVGEEIAFAPEARLVTHRPATISDYWTAIVRSYTSHLAALWHHRSTFVKRPLWAVTELYVTGFSLALAMASIVGMTALVLRPSARKTVGQIAVLLALWIGGRRAALGGELAAYTGERHWLWRAWGPTVLLPLQFTAAVVAVLRVRRQPSFDYKGPRSTPTG